MRNSGNHRVQKFDSDGRFLLKWGRPGRWSEANTKVMKRTADFRDHIAHAIAKQTDRVFDNPAALDTAVQDGKIKIY